MSHLNYSNGIQTDDRVIRKENRVAETHEDILLMLQFQRPLRRRHMTAMPCHLIVIQL
jgi:hypothetical protein